MRTDPKFGVRIVPAKLVGLLLAIVATLLLIHIILQVWHYQWQELPWLLREFFDVDEEDSLPTWYSSSALLLAAVLLFLIAQQKRQESDRWTKHWYGLSLTFLVLSMDEIAGVHEAINAVTDFSWVIPVGAAAALLGLAFVRFVLHLPVATRNLVVISGVVFLSGAVGVEWATDWYKDADRLSTLAYNFWTAAEEGLEMVGVVLFIHALLGYMAEGRDIPVDVTVDPGDTQI